MRRVSKQKRALLQRSPIGKLHVITDTSVQQRFSHVELAELAIAGGADTIQFRDKSSGTRAIIETAKAILALCRRSGTTFIVNDRVDIALAVDADGVHLGQRDLPIGEARRLLGAAKLIGGTASSPTEAKRVERDGADYVGFGHIYRTSSKDKPDAPRGLDMLGRVCRTVSVPVVAIGGINATNIDPVVGAGAWGVAIIGAVCNAANPQTATTELMERIRKQGKEA
jgi:thiamine-phosphate pyrophosphorylase